jgi:hypothetical protein
MAKAKVPKKYEKKLELKNEVEFSDLIGLSLQTLKKTKPVKKAKKK